MMKNQEPSKVYKARPDYIDAALANPKKFFIVIRWMDSYEEPNYGFNRVYVYPKVPKDHLDFTTVDNPEDAAALIDTFEEQNPEDMRDKRDQDR